VGPSGGSLEECGVADRDAALPLLERLPRQYFSIRLVWADSGYAGRLVDRAAEKW
jgi:hypothetical protein